MTGVTVRQSILRWLFSAGAVAAVGAVVCGQAGIASAAPATRVGERVSSAPAIATYVPPSKALYFGEKGAAVRSVQRRLAELHYYPGPIDGQYGQDLQVAAWAFREVQGLRLNDTSSLQPITRAFERALVHPKNPYALVRKGGPNRIEINQTIQVLVLYHDNKPYLILHISSGGRYYYCNQGSCGYAVTPDGNYAALSFLAGPIQVPLGWMTNPVFFIGRAYAIHGGDPVPWYPTSHGCVRIYDDVMTWFHTKVSIGGRHPTPIYVRGTAPAYPASN